MTLNTVDLGPKRPFSVGECALWARLTGPRFPAQVAAAVSLVEASAAVESATAAGAAAKAAADAPGAEAALSPELSKEPGGGAEGMAEDAEEIPRRPEELETRGGSRSSEGANAAAQAERSTPTKLLRSPQHSNALILNAITTLNLSSEFAFMKIYPHSTNSKSSPVDRDLSRSPNSNFKMKLHSKVLQQVPCI